MDMERKLEGAKKPEDGVEKERILQVLQELRKVFLPGFSPLPSLVEIAEGGEKTMKFVRPFLGHSERMIWLKDFLERFQTEMRHALPQEVDMDVLIDIKKWNAFYKEHETDGIGERIFGIVRKMREEFRAKIDGFENENAQNYQI